MTSEERMSILRMLANGKISVDEAEKLLKAVGSPPERESQRDFRRSAPRRPRELGDFMDDIGDEVRKAVKSVQASEIGKVVNQEVGRAVGSLQRLDVGRMVGEIVEQVREAVSDVVESTGAEPLVEELEWTLERADAMRLEVSNVSGNIRVTGVEGDQVHVKATKRVRARSEEDARAYAAQVEVRAGREGEAIRVTTDQPTPPRGVQVSVGYEIECPRALDVDVRLVNGNVECTGTGAALQAQTVNGNVRIDGCSGRVEARSRNGNARARLTELRHEGVFTTTNGNVKVALESGQAPLTATTTNGNVELALPPGFCGHLDARTTNGGVSSDIELTRVEQSRRNLLVGDLGTGGAAELRLHSHNGGVRVRSSAAADEESE